MRADKQYRETQILTATPEKLLIMLYDGAILALEKAIGSLQMPHPKHHYDEVNKELIKAQDIVGELMATLDLEKGGEIAQNLQSLYAYFLRKIMEGNVNKDQKPITEVKEFLVELRNSWKAILDKPSNHKTQTSGNSGKKTRESPTKGGFNISG